MASRSRGPRRWVELERSNGKKEYKLIGFGVYASKFILNNDLVNEFEDACCAKFSEEEINWYLRTRGADFDVNLTALHIKTISACMVALFSILGDDFVGILSKISS